MYEINLRDYSSCICCDNLVSFYAEDINAFATEWLAQDAVADESKKRFLRSKAGELVVDSDNDYYSDKKEICNIVREDSNAIYLWEKEFDISKRTITLRDAYFFERDVFLEEGYVKLKCILFGGHTQLIGKYKIRLNDPRLLFRTPRLQRSRDLGNPIFLCNDADCTLETYCYVGVWIDEKSYEEVMEEISDSVLQELMRDVVGACGAYAKCID